MGLEQVKEEILQQSKQEASSIIAKAKKECDKILAEAKEKAHKLRDKEIARTQHLLDTLHRQTLSTINFEASKEKMNKKKELISRVHQEVLDRIQKMDVKKRERHIKHLLSRAKKEIDIGQVTLNKKDQSAVKDIKTVPGNILGGVIAHNTDDTISIDYSFDLMIDHLFENNLQQISKVLFKNA